MTEFDLTTQEYDREPSLDELLSPAIRLRLEKFLSPLLGDAWQLIDQAGKPLLTGPVKPGKEARRQPLKIELEPLGWLYAEQTEPVLQGAAGLITTLLIERWRYQMSAEAHREITTADYAELQRRHLALQGSENRYRELAATLELRVKQQVTKIEQQQRELYQADKQASVGQLAAGVAHEINNPIGFVKSNLGTGLGYLKSIRELLFLLRNRGDPALLTAWNRYDLDFVLSDFASLLQESQDGISRVASIVADLKTFSAVDMEGRSTLDLNEQLRIACHLAQLQVPSSQPIILQPGTVPPLVCQAGAVGQALLHLVMNALQATRGGGTVTVTTRQDPEGVTIRVEDEGCGIPADIQARIFEPFFTTREVGQGKGLGLTVCHDVARAHGGRISFTSETGRGSCFELTLPVT